MATYQRALFLSLFLVLSSFSGISSASDNFSQSHGMDTFPVGWQEIVWAGIDNETHWGQIYYPANVSGLGKPMDNASGPYPVLIWIGDDGETSEQYDWLGEAVASKGYIAVVLPPDWNPDNTLGQCGDILAMWFRLQYNNENGSFVGDPENMQDSFDLDHWGIGGHGQGAKQAALCQLVLTGAWSEYITNPPPTALIALGLEDANTDVPESYLGSPPEPGMGLYLTGTEDDIAKADSNIDTWLANHDIPWHYMSVTGANHIQYQDESGFWEGFNDGSATMSREEQQSHAMQHIGPYLDLMLKGDHSQWLSATNREVDWQTPSDSNAEIFEDLSRARFLPMFANSSDVSEMEGDSGRIVSVNTKLTHRNGELPMGTTVLCTVVESGDWWDSMDYPSYTIAATGTFTESIENGTSSATGCEVSTESVPPGNRSLRVGVNWYGMPSFLDLDFFRENRQPILASPLPTIQVPQHGNASIPYSDFAIDPDGTNLVVEMVPHPPSSALNPSSNQMHCYLEENSVVCEHTGQPEWTGTEILNLTIFDRYDSNFSAQLNLSATVFAVDDPIVQVSDIPPLSMLEDDPRYAYTFISHFEDPEGANATIVSAVATEGLLVTWTDHNVAVEPLPNWHGSTTVEVLVGDGTTSPIIATFIVEVVSVPDAPRLNLTRVSLIEDTPLEIPLEELGWDEDGDAIEFEIEGSHPHLSAVVLTNVLRIVPSSDWSGLSTGWNLTGTSVDGNSSVPIEFEVSEVNDPIQVTWGSLQSEDDSVEFIIAIHDPDDDTPWNMRYQWDSNMWSEFVADCSASDPSAENPNDWECTVQISIADLSPGAYRLHVEAYEDGTWAVNKTYYHNVPISSNGTNQDDNNPQQTIDDDRESFSIWIVFSIVFGGVVAIVGLYMVATLSKEDMEEMLGGSNSTADTSDEELEELEAELVDFD
ncbi:MAG: hypothetical protein VX473_03390 [Candidatus Thermoplasmatota archaeon]|nr:hypothetical protein [Candidatus Thermoplasmatota archaeon]